STSPPCEVITTGRRILPVCFRILRNCPADPGMICPSAEIHCGQLGSQPTMPLRTTAKTMGGEGGTWNSGFFLTVDALAASAWTNRNTSSHAQLKIRLSRSITSPFTHDL